MNNVANWNTSCSTTRNPMFENEPPRFLRWPPANLAGLWPTMGYSKHAVMAQSMTGLTGMKLKACQGCWSSLGAGGSPRFFPQYLTPEAAREATLHVIRRDPRQFELPQTRWSLSAIQDVCQWLQGITRPGVSKVLRRLRISLGRGRASIHSPDPYYVAKLQTIQMVARRSRQHQERLVLLFQDEFSYERQPCVSRAYAPMGHEQALARRTQAYNAQRRITATVDAFSGRVCYQQARRITVPTLNRFYESLCYEQYPQATLIYLVQDNWPVHFHPDILGRLIPQTWITPPPVPPNWPSAPSSKTLKKPKLPLKILPLPTYASWTNPIEQLWRWLRHDVLHLHRLAECWPQLQSLVSQFLDQFAQGSTQLLRYVGLTKSTGIYQVIAQANGLPPPLSD